MRSISTNKFSYGYSKYSCPFSLYPITDRLFSREPKRGDVVVFRHPVNGKDFVKRLIGFGRGWITDSCRNARIHKGRL